MVLTTDIPLEIPRVHPSLRPLGAFEELLWQMDRRSQLHATLAAHIDGSTTIKQWRRSRVLIVDVAIEEVHDNLQHRLEEAYFFAGFAAKEAKALGFHRLFLLELESSLP